jgi:fatty-acyl-CoA synthase
MFESTMQDTPLTVGSIIRHGARVFSRSEIVTFEGDHTRRASFAQVAERAGRLAAALTRLGVKRGDRVATFSWNTQEHLEAYFAVPAMGAVLHTLNIRLFPEQIIYIANHAEDSVVILDATLLPLWDKLAPHLKTVKHVVAFGGDVPGALKYEELLAAEKPGFEWPDLDERSAAAMCYTSGTTGNPKGVVYSHRSNYLHSMAVCAGSCFGLGENDRILPIVPMFHANAWGLPYAGWMAGASFIFTGRFLQAEPLSRLIAAEKPTFAGAVPTVWNDLLRWGESNPLDLSSLRLVVCGGSAVPRVLMQRFQERYGVRILQAWGMTETSPCAAISLPPAGRPAEEEWSWREKTGRIVAGVELRICGDDGKELPWDGESVGEIEVRGSWITARYHKDPSPEKFHDGWLRTGDVGSVDSHGYIKITDRAKDVIKSGGEWICSVDLENAIMSHPDVAEAAVIGVPDPRWDERPLACVVRKPGSGIGADELRAFLQGKIAKWWMPERFAFIDQVPRTSVGKFDKKVLRASFAEGKLTIVTSGQAVR